MSANDYALLIAILGILGVIQGAAMWLFAHGLQAMHRDILQNRQYVQEAHRAIGDLHVRLTPFENDRHKRIEAEDFAREQREALIQHYRGTIGPNGCHVEKLVSTHTPVFPEDVERFRKEQAERKAARASELLKQSQQHWSNPQDCTHDAP